jgi:hypothetical protein
MTISASMKEAGHKGEPQAAVLGGKFGGRARVIEVDGEVLPDLDLFRLRG